MFPGGSIHAVQSETKSPVISIKPFVSFTLRAEKTVGFQHTWQGMTMRRISSNTVFANEKGVKGVLFSLCSVSQTSKALAGLTTPPYVTVGILVLTMPQEWQIPKDTFWNAAAQRLHVKVVTATEPQLSAQLQGSPRSASFPGVLFTHRNALDTPHLDWGRMPSLLLAEYMILELSLDWSHHQPGLSTHEWSNFSSTHGAQMGPFLCWGLIILSQDARSSSLSVSSCF